MQNNIFQLGFFCEANACVKEGECDAQHPCDGANSICDINVTPYNDCEWCDFDNKECKPGMMVDGGWWMVGTLYGHTGYFFRM